MANKTVRLQALDGTNIDVLYVDNGDGTWSLSTSSGVSEVTLGAGDNNIGNIDVISVAPGTGATNLGKAEDAAHASGDVGVMPLAVRSDTATAVATAGDYHPFLVDSNGAVWVHQGDLAASADQVSIGVKSTGGGVSRVYLPAAAADQDSTIVVAAACTLYGVEGFTLDATPVYVKIYNKATAPTSADTPIRVVMIPSNATAANGAGATPPIPSQGIALSAGLSFRVTTGMAHNNAGAVTAAENIVNILASA